MSSNPDIRVIELTEIRHPDKGSGRIVDPIKVDSIADSIKEIGLRQPITVRPKTEDDDPDGPEYIIVAGQHRYLAVAKTGAEHIDAIVMNADALHTELWTIDENLLRSEPSAAERSRGFYRRKAIYEALYPQTKAGKSQAKAMHRTCESELWTHMDADDQEASDFGGNQPASFIDDTARKTGRSRSTISKDVQRANKISDEILDDISGTELDTGRYMDRLAKLDDDEQRETVTADLEFGESPVDGDEWCEPDDDAEAEDDDFADPVDDEPQPTRYEDLTVYQQRCHDLMPWPERQVYLRLSEENKRHFENFNFHERKFVSTDGQFDFEGYKQYRKDNERGIELAEGGHIFHAMKAQYRHEFLCLCAEEIGHYLISAEEYKELYIAAYGEDGFKRELARQRAEEEALNEAKRQKVAEEVRQKQKAAQQNNDAPALTQHTTREAS